ncbi:MAG: hypothetical protein WDN72_05655 [Alphaproteobacteria bacterium]
MDPSKATGQIDAKMTLEFQADSGRPDDGKAHLDAIGYALDATLKQVAQPGLFGRGDLSRLRRHAPPRRHQGPPARRRAGDERRHRPARWPSPKRRTAT